MAEPSHAVFLSYASQDAAAAERIATALRAASIEVWFDKSELRGGDAWDQSIRRQIKNCTLFIPVISRNTDARAEGYFRLEWKLAVDRSHLFTATKAFLVPIGIDDTPNDDEQVPDRFRELQWTGLPGGETPPAFVDRVQHLLSGEASTPIKASVPAREQAPASSPLKRVLPVAVALVIALLVVLGFFGLERLRGSRPSVQGESIAVLPLRNATTPGRHSSGSIEPGAIAILGSRTSSTTRSSCALRTIRASPRSARRWACRRLQRLESGPEPVGSSVLSYASHDAELRRAVRAFGRVRMAALEEITCQLDRLLLAGSSAPYLLTYDAAESDKSGRGSG